MTLSTITFTNIKLSVSKEHKKPKIKGTELILLYLKFESRIIEFESFSSKYKITYDNYKRIIKTLIQGKIIKKVNKSSSKFRSYKLIKFNIQIFPYSSKSDEILIFKYLHSSTITAESNSYIQIILNPNALYLLKQIKKIYKSKTFKKSSLVDNETRAEAFKVLIDLGAIRKIASKTYILREFYEQVLNEIKLRKNPPVINNSDPNSIIKDAKWEKFCNVHNIEISAYFDGLYNNLLHSIQHTNQNLLSSTNTAEGIKFLKKSIEQTQVTVIVYPETTIITLQCSESPIYPNYLLRF